MAADPLASLGAILLFAVAGLGLTGLLPGLLATAFPSRLGYAYLLGVAWVAGLLYALSHLFGVPLRAPAVFTVALIPPALALPALLRRRSLSSLEKWRDRRRWLGLAAFAVGAAVSLGVLADAMTEPVRDWDGRMTWSAQARYVRAEGTVDASALLRGKWYISHPQYPLLLPVAQVAVLEAFGADEDEQPFRAAYAAFLPALLLVLYDGARRWAGRAPAALAALAMTAVPFFAFGGEGGAISVYSDLPLAGFYGAGLVLLLRGRPRLSDGLAAGLLLGAAGLTKNEGTPLALLALASGGLMLGLLWRGRSRKRRAMKLALAAAGVALALSLLASWHAQIPNRQDENYAEFVDLGDFWPGVVTRIPSVGPVMLRQMLTWEHWAAFWWAAPLLLLAGWRGWLGGRRAVSLPLLLALAGPLAIAWGAYAVHWYPEDLARVTWNRLLMQGSVPLFLLLALCLRRVLQKASLSMPPQKLPPALR
ncbi:MAG TPA: hypothetical protein VMW27_30495 [Thermoanaerobaculia bacterium]|nr:hypothetical protein [Thermoanaerobaculia bacterium]